MKYCDKYVRECYFERRDMADDGSRYCGIDGGLINGKKHCILKHFVWELS